MPINELEGRQKVDDSGNYSFDQSQQEKKEFKGNSNDDSSWIWPTNEKAQRFYKALEGLTPGESLKQMRRNTLLGGCELK